MGQNYWRDVFDSTPLGSQQACEQILARDAKDLARRVLRNYGIEVRPRSPARTVQQGFFLRDCVIPSLLADQERRHFTGLQDRPQIWDRVPYLLDFGRRQGEAIACALESEEHVESVGRAAAILNSVVSIFDFLSDERHGSKLYTLVSHEFVSQLMNGDISDGERRSVLESCSPAAAGVLSLIFAFVQDCQKLLTESGQAGAYDTLARNVIAMRRAHYSLWEWGNSESVDGYSVCDAESKSVLPSVISRDLVTLASGYSVVGKFDFGLAIGKVCWHLDDIADVFQDYCTGRPNLLLYDFLTEARSGAPGEPQFADSAERCTHYLALLLRQLCRHDVSVTHDRRLSSTGSVTQFCHDALSDWLCQPRLC